MKKKELTITLSGPLGSGKSRIGFILEKFLKEQGFNIKHIDMEGTEETTKKYQKVIGESINEAIGALKDIIDISIIES